MNHSGLTLAPCAVALSLSSFASAQAAQYEVIDLGLLPSASPAESRAYGINNLHEVVGQARDSNGTLHAAVWLFCANYGLSAQQWHDLSPSGEAGYYGLARDINDHGIVVGSQTIHSHGASGTRPYVWDLGTPGNSIELDTFADHAIKDGYYWGNGDAWGINNETPALIVGATETESPINRELGFVYVQGQAASSIYPVSPIGTDPVSSCHAVSDSEWIAGLSYGGAFAHCNSQQSAVLWDGGSPGALDDFGANYGAKAWGVNTAAQAAGEWYVADGQSICTTHAAFWEDSSATPVDLGDPANGVPIYHASQAFKLTQANGLEVTVVGWDSFSAVAMRWRRDSSGNWAGADLNTLISNCTGWTLVRAWDISDDGWIVGEGGINNETHGFLLRPWCAGDINHDGLVDGADLGQLLGAWCATTGCAACNRSDLNGDGKVDGADLGILLGAWGTNCGCATSPPEEESMMSGSSGYQAGSGGLAAGLQALGFESVAAFTQWLASVGTPEQIQSALEWLYVFLTSPSGGAE